MDPTQRTAIVTGGSSGIGAATARALSARGVRVGVLDRDPTDAFACAVADLSDDAAVRAAVDDLVERLGGLDVLVNNAGVGAQGTVEDNSDDEWHRVFDVNVLGIIWCTQAFIPKMKEAGGGSIVNMSSGAAWTSSPGLGLYPATKSSVESLTKTMALELGPAAAPRKLRTRPTRLSMSAAESSSSKAGIGVPRRPFSIA